MCRGAIAKVVAATGKDMYKVGLLQKLGLRKNVTSGTREERGLMPLDTMIGTEALDCCRHRCAEAIGVDGLRNIWMQFERAACLEDQDHVILTTSLWNNAFWRPAPWCNEHLKRLFGIHIKRIARLRRLCIELQGHFDDLPATHGNTGRCPPNKISKELIKEIERGIELNTREDPSRRVLHVHAGEKLGGASSLLRKVTERGSDALRALHFNTLHNQLQAYLDKKGLTGLASHDVAHNSCTDCKIRRDVADAANTEITRLGHVLEDCEATLSKLKDNLDVRFLRFTSPPPPSKKQGRWIVSLHAV